MGALEGCNGAKNPMGQTYMEKQKHPSQVKVCSFPWQQMVIDPTGDVTPCCYYHAYKAGGENSPLGNVNKDSILDVWNGDQYKKLRQDHVDGNIQPGHPCSECMTFKINNKYPSFESKIDVYENNEGIYRTELPEHVANDLKSQKDLFLLENGHEIASVSSNIKSLETSSDAGLVLSGRVLYFTSSDRSPVILNGRRYELRAGKKKYQLPFFGFDIDAESGQNLLQAYEAYVKGETKLNSVPTHLGYASSVDCNLDCNYCSQNEHRAARLKLRDNVLNDVMDVVKKTILFTWAGGEPFFLKPFRQFLLDHEVTSNPNLLFGFTSNGTMVSDKQLAKLKTFPRISASVSMDSFVPETYERLRTPAKFDRVIQNYKKLQEPEDGLHWLIQCGMLVMKSNVHEIDKNVQFAVNNNIQVNLSPIVQYPLNERLDIFSDFWVESVGWEAAIRRAIDINAQARKENRLPQDMGGALKVVEEIYAKAKDQYEKSVCLEITIGDEFDSLKTHQHPGVIIGSNANNPIAYREIDEGPGKYKIWIKQEDIARLVSHSSEKQISFFHNIVEPWHPVLVKSLSPQQLSGIRHFNPRKSISSKAKEFISYAKSVIKGEFDSGNEIVMDIPKFYPPERRSNASLAKRLEALGLGVENIDGTQIFSSVRRRELAISEAAWNDGKSKLGADTDPFEMVVEPATINFVEGFSYYVEHPSLANCVSDATGISSLTVFEDDKPLPFARSLHEDIHKIGLGRFSHWLNTVYFSASDNSDPRTNGKSYKIMEFHEPSSTSDAWIEMNNFNPEIGNCYTFKTPIVYPSDIDRISDIEIYEDDRPLVPHSSHDAIRNLGKGRFSHWGQYIYFSSTDNSDPRTNGKKYRYKEVKNTQDKMALFKADF